MGILARLTSRSSAVHEGSVADAAARRALQRMRGVAPAGAALSISALPDALPDGAGPRYRVAWTGDRRAATSVLRTLVGIARDPDDDGHDAWGIELEVSDTAGDGSPRTTITTTSADRVDPAALLDLVAEIHGAHPTASVTLDLAGTLEVGGLPADALEPVVDDVLPRWERAMLAMPAGRRHREPAISFGIVDDGVRYSFGSSLDLMTHLAGVRPRSADGIGHRYEDTVPALVRALQAGVPAVRTAMGSTHVPYGSLVRCDFPPPDHDVAVTVTGPGPGVDARASRALAAELARLHPLLAVRSRA